MKRTTINPLTPALAAFRAGRTIAPVGYVDGRAVWPIAGGAPDDPPGDGGDGSGGGDGGRGSNSDDPPTNGGKDGEQQFPANTPVKDMTAEQRAAYYEHQARKHEDRNKDLLRITGGKYGNDLKTLLDERETLLEAQRTDAEKAVEQAKKDVRSEVQAEYGPKMARLAFESALSHIEDDAERNELLDALNLTSVLTESGDVDTAKVRSVVARIAPSDKGTGKREHDYGAGRRTGGTPPSGVNSGRELFTSRRKSTTT